MDSAIYGELFLYFSLHFENLGQENFVPAISSNICPSGYRARQAMAMLSSVMILMMQSSGVIMRVPVFNCYGFDQVVGFGGGGRGRGIREQVFPPHIQGM